MGSVVLMGSCTRRSPSCRVKVPTDDPDGNGALTTFKSVRWLTTMPSYATQLTSWSENTVAVSPQGAAYSPITWLVERTERKCRAEPTACTRLFVDEKTSSSVGNPIIAPNSRADWPSALTSAANTKQAPAAPLEPVLTPTIPSSPTTASTLNTLPAMGRVASGWATISANTGSRSAISARAIRSSGEPTVCGDRPVAST